MMKKQNTIYLGIGIVVIILIAAIAIFSAPKGEETIKIGLMGPFSGYAAQFGGMIDNGLNLALSELPEETRSKIEIVKEDDMCDSTEALNAAQKLIQVDGLDYVIGQMCNEAVLSTESLFENNKVIALTIGLPSNSIANMGPYHFSFSPEIKYLMSAIAKKAKDGGVNKIAIVYMYAPFETENHNHFIKYFKEAGGIIVADESIERGTTDFRTPIQKVKNKNPDAIFIAAHTNELISILKQLKEAGIDDLPKYGIHAAEAPVILSDAADLAEGLIYPYPADKTQSQSAIDYAKKYEEKYHFAPDPYSSNTYDSLKILVSAIKDCGYNNKECVLEKLSSIKNYPGANGLLSVDARGVGTYKKIMLKTVKDGKFIRLK